MPTLFPVIPIPTQGILPNIGAPLPFLPSAINPGTWTASPVGSAFSKTAPAQTNAPTAYPTIPPVALHLGGIPFLSFECPESIGDIGLQAKLAMHDFPGGYRTVQPLGFFPPQMITWSGQFWQNDIPGYTPQQRIINLEQIIINQVGVSLNIGPFTFNPVFVHKLELHMQLGWLLPYTIEIIPVNPGLTNAASLPSAAPSFPTIPQPLSGQ
jgi:hypothetical protein